MDWNQAIAVLAGAAGDADEARSVVYASVLAACETNAGPTGANSLGAWLAQIAWSGDETPDAIAAEWDAFNIGDD